MLEFHNVEQCSDEWYDLRCGMLTASEMEHILTAKTLKYSESEKEKTHLYELLAQRITKYVPRTFQSFDILRGKEEEFYAKQAYIEHYAPVRDVGFITNDRWGFPLGFSPDGLVGDDGMIECKSRLPKYQIKTILDDAMPDDFTIQVQTGLLVSEREWCDFISYSGGMMMFVKRVPASPMVQEKILEAAELFYKKLTRLEVLYKQMVDSGLHRLVPTERVNFEEIKAS